MKKFLVLGVFFSVCFILGCSYGGPCIHGYGPVTNQLRELAEFTAVSNTGDFEVRVSLSDTFSVEVQAQENLISSIETYVSGSTLIVKTTNNTCISSAVPVLVYVSMPYIEEIRNTGSGKLSADKAVVGEFECANSGSGIISIDSVFASVVSLKNSGSGKLYLGESFPDEIEMIQTGSGILDAGFINIPLEVNVNHTSSGRIYASVLDGLDVEAKLTGSGLIILDGVAETADLTLSSSGKIDALDMLTKEAKTLISGSGKIFVHATDYLDITITGSGNLYYRGNPLITTRITGSGNVRPY